MLTLAEPVESEFLIRQSRFIAHASPVNNQSETLEFFDSVADQAATHNCWAWKLDHTYRFNDDGEPASTAGKPILSAIDGKNLSCVMVVVTRHFGGIKLGVGGLIRAYSGSAARCLDQASIIEVHPSSTLVIEAGFEWTRQLHAAVDLCEAKKLQEAFTEKGIRMHVEVRDDRIRQLQKTLRDTTRGTATLLTA
jgi:uncharacterized YigZ family protein